MSPNSCSIYNALQLKEFLFPQRSQFYYENLSSKIIYGRNDNMLCSAYLADELLNFIPNPIEKDGYTYQLTIIKSDIYHIELRGNQIDGDELVYRTQNKNLADALAKTLIFLIENDFIGFE